MKLGLKSRSQRAIQGSSILTGSGKRGKNDDNYSIDDDIMSENYCFWSNLPPELLREVLIKIEESESKWPMRKHVVAFAGVCKSWRELTMEVVRIPELSGKFTFPISVKQPGPRESLLQCFIKRNSSTQTYFLYQSLTRALRDNGKFLLAARKCRRPTSTDYVVSLCADDMSKRSGNYIGKLRSNFLGTKFVVYDALPPAGAKLVKSNSTLTGGIAQVSPKASAGNYPIAHISYELNALGARGPRRMHCVMDAIPASAIKPEGVAPTQINFPVSSIESFPVIPYCRTKSSRLDKTLSGPLDCQRDGSLVLGNKAPTWHDHLQCWCLNFHGRVTLASVKNFQLVASPVNGQAGPEHEKVILQFGKVGKDVYTMDYRYPLSAFQAFAICLSSFDTKIACE